ncbi:MAG: hypothetical protein ACK4NC_01125 [Candidatus Gracilibacteria bacterium]
MAGNEEWALEEFNKIFYAFTEEQEPSKEEAEMITKYKDFILSAINNIYGPIYQFGILDVNEDYRDDDLILSRPIDNFIDEFSSKIIVDLPEDTVNLAKTIHVMDEKDTYSTSEMDFYNCFSKLPSIYDLDTILLDSKTESITQLMREFEYGAELILNEFDTKLKSFLVKHSKSLEGSYQIERRVKTPSSMFINRLLERKPFFLCADLFGLRVKPQKSNDINTLLELLLNDPDSPFVQIPLMSHVWDINDPNVDPVNGIRNSRNSRGFYKSLDFFVTMKEYTLKEFNSTKYYPAVIDFQLRTKEEQDNIEGSERNSKIYKYRQLLKLILLFISDRDFLNEKMLLSKVFIESLQIFNKKISHVKSVQFEHYLHMLKQIELKTWEKYGLSIPEYTNPVILAKKQKKKALKKTQQDQI